MERRFLTFSPLLKFKAVLLLLTAFAFYTCWSFNVQHRLYYEYFSSDGTDEIFETNSIRDAEAAFFSNFWGNQNMSFLAPRLERVLSTTRLNPYDYEHFQNKKKLNVHVLLLDMVSREYFLRSANQSLHFLSERQYKPNKTASPFAKPRFLAFQFNQYSVTGRNSPPNQFPMFAGRPLSNSSTPHVKLMNLTHYGYVKDLVGDETLFAIAKALGYVVAYDACEERSIFSSQEPLYHFQTYPFYRQYSTDGYVSEKAAMGLWYGNRRVVDMSTELIDNVRRNYPDRALFTITNFMDLHELTYTHLSTFDTDLVRLLERLEAGLMDANSVVFLVADHGPHYGQHGMATYPNEHLNPFFAALLPDGMLVPPVAEAVFAALAHNQNTPLSHYDFYATVRDTFGLFDPERTEQLRKTYAGSPTGQSMYSPIPHRTCEEMGLKEWYCANRLMERVTNTTEAQHWFKKGQALAEARCSYKGKPFLYDFSTPPAVFQSPPAAGKALLTVTVHPFYIFGLDWVFVRFEGPPENPTFVSISCDNTD